MDYSGGYGDDLSAEELIDRLETLNALRARERAHPGAEYEDLLQEARIAAWSACRRHPGHTRQYYSAACGNRISELAARQNWTGHTRVHGQPTDPLRNRAKSSLDDPDHPLLAELAAPDWLAAAELAYHRGEITAALNALPDRAREYVWRRFWCGQSAGELDALLGGNTWRLWQTTRTQLRAVLSSLR